MSGPERDYNFELDGIKHSTDITEELLASPLASPTDSHCLGVPSGNSSASGCSVVLLRVRQIFVFLELGGSAAI